MKNIQPDLNQRKEIRSAVAQITFYLGAQQTEKAIYAMELLNKMLDTFDQGEPQPWSNFLPMIFEEFD